MASVDYLITTRAIKDGQFVAGVGSTRYLRVPSRIVIPTPEMAAPNARDQALWVKEVRDLADGDPNQNSISIAGDILIFIHGYNNDLDIIMNRVFARDLAMTLEGAIDRYAIPTREKVNGQLSLKDAPRPRFMSQWEVKDAVKKAANG